MPLPIRAGALDALRRTLDESPRASALEGGNGARCASRHRRRVRRSACPSLRRRSDGRRPDGGSRMVRESSGTCGARPRVRGGDPIVRASTRRSRRSRPIPTWRYRLTSRSRVPRCCAMPATKGSSTPGSEAAATARRLGDAERMARAVLSMDQDGFHRSLQRLGRRTAQRSSPSHRGARRTSRRRSWPVSSACRQFGCTGAPSATNVIATRARSARHGTRGGERSVDVADPGAQLGVSLDESQPHMNEVAAYSRETLALAAPGTSAYMNALANLCARGRDDR
jgi:hypothetical protein